MRRLLAVAVFGVGTLGAIGCAGNATFVKKFPDGGVIALKPGGDQAEVRKMIEKHIGPDFEINTVDPNYQAGGFDPSQPKAEPGEMHYVYKKKAKTDVTGLPPAPGTGMGMGMGMGMPKLGAPGGVGQAGFQQPAGTGMPGGSSGFGTAGGMQPPSVFPGSK